MSSFQEPDFRRQSKNRGLCLRSSQWQQIQTVVQYRNDCTTLCSFKRTTALTSSNLFDQALKKPACELKRRLSEALPSIRFRAARLSAFPWQIRFAGCLVSRPLPNLPSLMDLAETSSFPLGEGSEMTNQPFANTFVVKGIPRFERPTPASAPQSPSSKGFPPKGKMSHFLWPGWGKRTQKTAAPEIRQRYGRPPYWDARLGTTPGNTRFSLDFLHIPDRDKEVIPF